jgi:cephalosporin-C deacetylase-like acetyl esterase
MNPLKPSFLLFLLLASPLRAQPNTDLDFLSGLPDFQNFKRMLPEYLNGKAKNLLEQRRTAISRFSNNQDVAHQKAYLRERMLEALGGFPEKTPLNAQSVGVLEREDYRIEKVIFESQPRFFVTANLYLPRKGNPPYPGILFPLGHEEGAKAHGTWQQVLVSLARRGFVCLAWDTLGQGERLQFYDADFQGSKLAGSTTAHTMLGVQCLLVGDNVARYTIWDGIRALDYLLSRKEVDSSRIGCTGNSGGGTHTAYLSALDDRIHVAAPSCYLTSWQRLLDTIGPQDAEQCLPPSLADGLDHADFIYAFAPKPYLILSAIRDFFSILGTRETFHEAQGVYALMGEPEKLRMFEADDGHGYSQPRRLEAYRWFSRWLKGVENQDPEVPVASESEEELNCTGTGQVITALTGETVFSLNLQRFQQLKRAWPSVVTLEDQKRVSGEVRRQAARLCGFDLSLLEVRRQAPRVDQYGGVSRVPEYRIEKLTYESELGVLIPALLFVPNGQDAKHPAIVFAHGKGKAAEAGIGGDIEQFVKKGYVVLALDLRGFGETAPALKPEQTNEMVRCFGDYDSAMTALLIGKPLVGMRALDICRGADLLESRPEVDAGKICGFGVEGGAVPMLYASVFDPRFRRVVLEDMICSYESIVSRRIHHGVFEQIVPQALKYYDLQDLVAATTSRKVWIVNSVNQLGQHIRSREVVRLYSRAINGFRLAGAHGALYIRDRQPGEGVFPLYQDLAGYP